MDTKNSIGRKIGTIVWRFLITVLSTALVLVAACVGLICVFNYGPSASARNLFVTSVLETSALKFAATWFLPAEEINTILADNSLEVMDEVTNPDLVIINRDEIENQEGEDIEVIEVNGLTYTGRMMIVKDPSRVKVGVCKWLGSADSYGEHVYDMVDRYGAVAGVNGGGFDDPNGHGKGAVPLGFVFSEGEYLWGPEDEEEILIGFDQNDKLIVGSMTGKEAVELGIRDALSYGPALIINGDPADISGVSSGLNPRTAIGQREDGAVLLLVIDGRQANSLGALYSDLIEVMLEFGAVNAGNLDGGSSSLMVYQGEILSNKANITGDRCIPTCVLVE